MKSFIQSKCLIEVLIKGSDAKPNNGESDTFVGSEGIG